MSTGDVAADEAFALWRDLISATFVPLSAEPAGTDSFRGAIDHVAVGCLELSSVVASAQEVRRTRSLVARSDGEYLLCSIQVRGHGAVEQDGRIAKLRPGDLALYDSSRPYTLSFDRSFEQLVVQVPRDAVLLPSADPRRVTARRVSSEGVGAAVGGFFRGLARAATTRDDGALATVPHALGLLGSVAASAQPTPPSTDVSVALARERVRRHLRENIADPGLDAETVARACHLSRRSLYRLYEAYPGGGVMTELRRLRIDRATDLLLAHPNRPVALIALACGFTSESAFYRAFRAVTGRTPRSSRAAGVGHGGAGQRHF